MEMNAVRLSISGEVEGLELDFNDREALMDAIGAKRKVAYVYESFSLEVLSDGLEVPIMAIVDKDEDPEKGDNVNGHVFLERKELFSDLLITGKGDEGDPLPLDEIDVRTIIDYIQDDDFPF